MKLREVKLAQSKGMDILQACRQAGVSDQSYCRWRKDLAGIFIEMKNITILLLILLEMT